MMTKTVSGHKALRHEEPLIFEQSSEGACGVDLPHLPTEFTPQIGQVTRRRAIGLPSLSEPQVVRHYTRLSQLNYAIDTGLYPLGSCTMKHNPRLNEKMARLKGLGDLHPLQPLSTTQGALQLMDELATWLKELTGMPAVTLTPAAGAHGETCGMMAIKAALAARGEDKTRIKVLVPESAHGTNPATAAALGFTVEPLKAQKNGRISVTTLKQALTPDVAALMLTNPNTCGLFERDIRAMGEAVREAGAYFYCDGANFNALVGRVKPADFLIDCMHINLHKTFSTPHGGGGPGSGPVVFSERLAPFLPVPFTSQDPSSLTFSLTEETQNAPQTLGRMKAFHGQMGMLIRALAYCLSHGADGLRQVSGDAVLSANYLLAALGDAMSPPYPGPCMHEVLFDDTFLHGTDISTLDFAKAMIDEGFHPMTMYFPLVIHGAFLIEPTECESKAELDSFIATMRALAKIATHGSSEEKQATFKQAPRLAPRGRVNETKAAREPHLSFCCSA